MHVQALPRYPNAGSSLEHIPIAASEGAKDADLGTVSLIALGIFSGTYGAIVGEGGGFLMSPMLIFIVGFSAGRSGWHELGGGAGNLYLFRHWLCPYQVN